MPILLDDLASSVGKTPSYSPKFFDQKLTGNGKTIGLLNEKINPVNVPADVRTTNEHKQSVHRKYVNGQTEVRIIPVNPVGTEAWSYMDKIARPDAADMVCVLDVPGSATDPRIYFTMQPHSVVIEETRLAPDPGSNAVSRMQRDVSVCYHVLVLAVQDNADDQHVWVRDPSHMGRLLDKTVSPCDRFGNPVKAASRNAYFYEMTCTPVDWAADALHELQSVLPPDYVLHRRELDEYFQSYSAYDAMCARSEQWQTGIDEILLQLFRNVAGSKHHLFDNVALNCVARTLTCLENYPVPLNLCRKIYQDITAAFPPAKAATLCKQNLNLLLSDTLNTLDKNKASIPGVPAPAPGTPVPPSVQRLSREQHAAVTSTDPLVLVQSGAGTGKAHPLYTLILTPTGWKPLGKLKVGDLVIGSDGKPYPIQKIHDRGLLPGYHLTFQDGSKIDACGEHLWTVRRIINGVERRDTITTQEWIFQRKYRAYAYLPAAPCIEYEYGEKRLAHSPYAIGAAMAAGDIAGHIPDEYMTASPGQRKELLSALFQTAGGVMESNERPYFNTKNPDLASDAVSLLWSLGLPAVRRYKRSGRGGRYSVVMLDPKPAVWNPFGQSGAARKSGKRTRHPRRTLKSAEPFDPVPMKCIEIDSPDHLYVAQDFIVTHNSTTILSRVDHMIASGIQPQDIMVLSFTNAAADHIKEKNPSIHSMTIARMIHTIYSENFPGHELSTLDTIINSLEIYYPDDDLAVRFRRHCLDVNTNQTGAFIRINNFVEAHYDAVIAMLDGIRQTSLELEIIICYQQIDYLKEPAEVRSKYLIIDEVQDNSIFEFVYTLRYVRKHNESLFIVGDCSQTLYEFRGSEPKALNVMEGSGVFSTYQLQVNYRSNQEILDFANVLLQRIEANQYAQIQLQANALSPVTEQSFTDKVKLHYEQVFKKRDLPDRLPTIFANVLKPYLDAKLAAGEQVAFLAHTRNTVGAIQAHLEKMYPGRKTVNMIPEKPYNSTIFSVFVKKYWSSISFVPTQSLTDVIETAILSHLDDVMPRMDSIKATAIAVSTISKWKLQYKNDIDGWVRAYRNGVYSLAQLMDDVKFSMLDAEIGMNAVRQRMVSMRNEQAKQNQDIQTADFLLSTIHSAKGLEFDNVVVVYDASNQMEEADKRMYYVAFTRAMKSEFIVAYGGVVNPRVKLDYDTIVEKLRTKNAGRPAPAAVPAAAPMAPLSDVFTPVEDGSAGNPSACAAVQAGPVPGPAPMADPTDTAKSALGACGYVFAQSPDAPMPDPDED